MDRQQSMESNHLVCLSKVGSIPKSYMLRIALKNEKMVKLNINSYTYKIFYYYNRNIRTNNDNEGWHNRMNQRASSRHQLQFYLLVKLLHSETILVELQVELVSQAKLTRIQRKRYRDMQSKIIRLWDRFVNDEIDSYRLLKKCSFWQYLRFDSY